MLKLHTILVPSDLSVSARNAFHVARDLGDRFRAAVHVLHVTPEAGQFASIARWLTGQSAPDKEADDRAIEEAMEREFGAYEHLKHVHRRGDVVATILEYAEDCDIDLIVMGTRGVRSLEHPALGGIAGEVVRNSARSVLTVPALGEISFEGFRRVVVALDFARVSAELLRGAKHLASVYGAKLSMVFVAEEHTVPMFLDTGLVSVTTLKVDEEIAARADDALRQLDEETGAFDLEREHVVLRGNPAREIVAYAERIDADLIVMGRRGQSPHEGLLLGTVSEHVIRRSRCPVFTLGSGS